MNKRTLLIGVVVILVVSLFFIYRTGASSSEPKLSQSEIKKLVEEQYPGDQNEPNLQLKDGEPVYQVEVRQENGSYEVLLDGNTGKVLDIYQTEAEKAENVEPDDNNNTTPDENSNKDNDQDSQQNNDDTDKADKDEPSSEQGNNAIISSDEAKEIALQQFSGTVSELELDEDDGTMIYEIEIVDGNKEANIEINAYTGNVIVIETEVDDD
ncbi:PepSY domain-containing protein [Oceanobacillus kimchii]|uniref:PepSY domain-containing protein n=1 Tax=Oceanobacillus kimchii TaxID=746691 RepID=UPI0021A2B82E|nr:PepSY domain-containing protein [Oceanobacillus kimchii]MCT1577353.1 PepSY domain-containing protein [Oceanobacillus kimchii]MCT2136959.1 PepSY domain-containing protein [Oceanobacillus kimchii]